MDELWSVFARQQNRRRRSVVPIIHRFGDDPELYTERRVVGGEKAGAVDQRLFVRLLVLVADIAPVASCVPLKELSGRLMGVFEDFEGTRRCDDLPERKL